MAILNHADLVFSIKFRPFKPTVKLTHTLNSRELIISSKKKKQVNIHHHIQEEFYDIIWEELIPVSLLH